MDWFEVALVCFEVVCGVALGWIIATGRGAAATWHTGLGL